MSTLYHIESGYPGGNIKISDSAPGRVLLSQDVRNASWWFYWNFRISNPPQGEVVFEFNNGETIGPHGPAVSRDGVNWSWAGEETLLKKKTRAEWLRNDDKSASQSFKYRFSGNESHLYFARHFPYPVSFFETFLKTQPSPCRTQKSLCRSTNGREVPVFQIAKSSHPQKCAVIACRHHASESHASYLLEGMMAALSQKPPEDTAFHFIPFADIDGVEAGDQGKNRLPHDQNRDYIAQPLYKETGPIMDYVQKLNPDFVLDLHCPGIAQEARYHGMFYNTHPAMKDRFLKFQKYLLKEMNDARFPAPMYTPALDEFTDQAANTTFAAFARSLGVPLVLTFEQNYFSLGRPLTQSDLRKSGECFGRAVALYLSSH